MIQLIRVPNPFEPRKHTVEDVLYTGKAITSYLNVTDMDCVLNGQLVDNPAETIPQDGEQLIVMPHVGGKGIKRILGFAAMIALSVYAGHIAGGSAKLFGYAFKAHTVGALLASGAVMFLGGKIINSIFPQQNPSFSYGDQDTSQSYGWDLPTPTQIAGGVVGETYGECIPAPQLLEQHVETINDKQYLNLLYCGGYGPIDSIDDMRIDYTSLENFSGVQVETRLGTNDQKPISFFKNTPLDQSVGVEVPDDNSVTRTSDSTNASALEVTLEWPGGLFYINDNNNYANATVKFKLEYRLTGTTTWRNFNKDNPDYVYEATAGTNAAVRKSYLVDGLDAGQYDVRITTVDRPKTTRYQSMYQWTLLTSYLDGVYARPGKVLVALRILATNQLSGGVPSLNWRQKRAHVWVWDPTLDHPAYVEKPADNPIWAAYDILHGCKRLKNINTGEFEFVASGVPKEALTAYYDEWESAAAYADEEITNQDGKKEPRYRFDAFFDSAQKRITAAQKAATIGHAAIIPHGRNYGIVVDRPGSITQIFGEGRTTVSSVKGSFTSKADRARAIEVTYNDTQNDFKNTVLTVRSPNYNTDNGSDNTAQLSLFGVKRRSQAYREAITALATNERQLQFVEMSADIDAIVAEYGDIVGYSHAVSRIGIASGRLAAATTTTLTLDKDVTMDAAKSYEIYIQKANDTLVKLPVVSKNYTGNILTLTAALDADAVPAQYDNYAFGEVGKAVKPFRVVSASRDGDMLVSLKLAEYDEAIYADELDYSKYPAVDYSSAPTLDTVASVTATEQTIKQAYTSNNNILVTWAMVGKGTSPDSFRVYLKSKDSEYSDVKNVRGIGCVFSNVPAGEAYDITVYGVFDAVLYGQASTTIKIESAAIAGEGAKAFHAVAIPGGIQLTWNLAADASVAAYRVNHDGDTLAETTGDQYFWPHREAGTYTFDLIQIDKEGKKVGGALSTSITVALPSAVTGAGAVCVYRHYENGSTGYDVDVNYNLPADAVAAEVYYKTNNTAMGLVGVIPEGAAGDAIGFTQDWKYAGSSTDKVTIAGAKLGDKYRIRIMSKSGAGLSCADSDAVFIDKTVQAKTEIPNKPQNFTKEFTAKGFVFRWNDVTNTDIDFYELRTNRNTGAVSGLLARVTGTSATVGLRARKATIYLYAHNTTGKYSIPASLSYNYPVLSAPAAVTSTRAPRAITIMVTDKPVAATGIHIYIKGGDLDTMIELTDTNQYTLAAKAGIYDVCSCYYDLFGEGEMGGTIQATIEAYFDPDWIKDGSISEAKVDSTVHSALADAREAIPRLDGIDTTLDGIDTTITGLKQTDTELSNTIVENKKTQDGQNSTFASQIKQNANNVTSIVENLNNEDPSSSAYKSITKLQQTADSISSTVQKNKSATDTAISKVDQKADSISSTVQKNKSATDTAISKVDQKADGISSTVQAYKETQDGKNKTYDGYSSKITQNASSINSIVTNLGKAPKDSGYSAITQLQDAVNLRVQKGDVINQINMTATGTTIDGKYLHVTGDTKFDNNVIVGGMIKSGVITADKLTAGTISLTNNQAVSGGSVVLNSSGLKCVLSDGSYITHDSNGIMYHGASGGAWSIVSIHLTASCKDGQRVRYATTWPSLPNLTTVFSSLKKETSTKSFNINGVTYIPKFGAMTTRTEIVNQSTSGFDCYNRSYYPKGTDAYIPLSYTSTKSASTENSDWIIGNYTSYTEEGYFLYTAPTAGTYKFSDTMQASGTEYRYDNGSDDGPSFSWTSASVTTVWYVNGTKIAEYSLKSPNNGTNTKEVTQNLKLNARDVVKITFSSQDDGETAEAHPGISGQTLPQDCIVEKGSVTVSCTLNESQNYTVEDI